MQCDDVRRIFYFFLDGTLTEQKRRSILEHLGLCANCERRMRVQQALRDFVRKRLGAVTAPDHLRVRLTRTLRAFAGE
jgi:mycothiol system anti-sigma-R factor